MTTERFVPSPLIPLTDSAGTSRMAAEEPGLPMRFTWRDRTVDIRTVLRNWISAGPCSHGSPEHYVRRYWFEDTSSCERLKIYVERQPRRGGRTARWWLYGRIEADEATPG